METKSKHILLSMKETYEIIKNAKDEDAGMYCRICGKSHYDAFSLKKKYCGNCNIYHEYANYLKFI